MYWQFITFFFFNRSTTAALLIKSAFNKFGKQPVFQKGKLLLSNIYFYYNF